MKQTLSHLPDTQENLLHKRERLMEARTVLKNEFTGIDAVIDQVADTITPWYLFPQLQDRPTIINLWGLTGVGKSSLVNRLTQLLEFDKQYFRFDLGESFDRDYSIKKKLTNLFPECNGIPMILAFDEFQHARTIDPHGGELDKGFTRTIWEILDSGKFSVNYYGRAQSDIVQLIHVLSDTLKRGVVVRDGVVVEGQEYFYTILNERGGGVGFVRPHGDIKTDIPEKQYFIDTRFIDSIFSLSLGRFGSEIELKTLLDTLDGPQTITLLEEIHENSLAPQQVDCTKSVVFIMGNLDEAYSMSHDLNPDISADEFHRISLKINLSTIKRALRKRFRQEQIARLGNCHIIYPALSQKSFQWIIEQELVKLISKANRIGIQLEVDESIHSLIYSEGVFPTQGVRPLYTTIHQVAGTQLGKIMSEKILLPHQENIVARMKWEEPHMVIDFMHQEKIVRTIREEMILSLGKLRQPTQDDLQAITAVHEAGHAILSMALLKIIPQAVYSVSADDGSAGFVYTKNDCQYISRHALPGRVAVMLGGLAAEEVVFGKEHVTTGAESDLRMATHLVNHLIMESGLGETVGHYQYPGKASTHHLLAGENQALQAEKLLKEAYELALKTLRDEKNWLIHLADFLSDCVMAGPKQLKQLALLYAEGFILDDLAQDSNHLFYRTRLKQLLHAGDAEATAMWPELSVASKHAGNHAA